MKLFQNLNFRLGCTILKRYFASDTEATLYSRSKKGSYFHTADNKGLFGATIGQLIDLIPDRFGDQLALIDCAQGIRKTHVELKDDIDKVATGFLALNLQRGDRIAIWSPNRYEWVLTQMAAAKAGLILVAINPAYQPNEFAYCLEKVGIRAVVFPENFKTQNYYKMILNLMPQVLDSKPGQIKSKTYPKFDTMIVLGDKDLPGTFKFKDIMNAGGSQEKIGLEKLQSEIQFDDPAIILFTSGTTGKPKAATITHMPMNNICAVISQNLGCFDQPTKICGPVPLFHAFGCVGVTITSIISGSCSVFPSPGFSSEHVLKSIEQEKCTCIFGTPTMYVDILNHPNFNKTDFSSINTGAVGGAPCPPYLMEEVMDKMDFSGLVNVYGATEMSPMISCHHSIKDDRNTKLANAGKVIPNIEVKIVDHTDKIVPMGATGEICARGFNVMKGYWNDEEKTNEVIRNGWYHTGDIGVLNKDGYLTVFGRMKDMIIRGGENIYAKEIEDFLISHPQISEVHVIGVPDKRMGEEVCAWIKLKPNETISENEVEEFCKGQIAHFKIPKYIRFVEDFPKTASGKVQKYLIREEMITILENN